MRAVRQALLALVLLALALAAPAPPAAAAEMRPHHVLEMVGSADLGSMTGDRFVGRALDDWGYNRNVVYEGSASPEYMGICMWTSGRITLVDRDGSTLTLELDGWEDRYCYGFVDQYRSGHFVVTGGTGHYAGTQGTAYVELSGTQAQLSGTLDLTLTG